MTDQNQVRAVDLLKKIIAGREVRRGDHTEIESLPDDEIERLVGDAIAALTPASQPEVQMERAKQLALQAIDAMPGAGPFTEEGREDDWRFRARLARKEALDAARAHIALAFDKAALTPAPDAAQTEAVPAGVAAYMPGTKGFTMAVFKADDVPDGSSVYIHPAAPAPEIAEAGRAALKELANTRMNISLTAWQRISSALAAALHALEGRK